MTYDLPAIASNLSAHSFRWMRVQAVKACLLAAVLIHLAGWSLAVILVLPFLLLLKVTELLLPGRFRCDKGVDWPAVLDTLKG